jgi:hypothetical protein
MFVDRCSFFRATKGEPFSSLPSSVFSHEMRTLNAKRSHSTICISLHVLSSELPIAFKLGFGI